MSDEEYPDEDYEYEYSDDEDGDGGDDDDDVSMDLDGSTDAAVSASSSSARRNSNPNKKRPYGSMDGKRRSGENPNAPPLAGGEFRFLSVDTLTPVMQSCTSAFELFWKYYLTHPFFAPNIVSTYIPAQMSLEYACFLRTS